MKIKYSALVSATSGKLNGSVAASNRGGAYLRNKGVTSNPQTVSQQANRSQFGSISSQFRSLSPAQIEAWNTAAKDFPVIDRFGDTRYLSGLALFVQLNKNLADIGIAPLVSPPVKQSFPAIIEIDASITLDDTSITAVALTIGGDANFTTGIRALVKATGIVSPSISYVKNQFRNIGSAVGGASPSIVFNAPPTYVAALGSASETQKIVFEVVLVSTVSGEKSAPFIVTGFPTPL